MVGLSRWWGCRVSWFPNNLARNSRAHLSNIEIRSLELQCLWRLLNDQANELRAKFWARGRGAGRSVVGSFWSIARRLAGGVLRRWSSTLPRDVGPRKFLKKCARGEGNRATREMGACHSNDTRYCGDCSFGTQDLVSCGGRALHLVEARAGWRKPPPPTVPRPRAAWGERPRRVGHASTSTGLAAHRSAGPTAPRRTTSAHSKHAETQKRQDQEHD